jgi:hypothetical protein
MMPFCFFLVVYFEYFFGCFVKGKRDFCWQHKGGRGVILFWDISLTGKRDPGRVFCVCCFRVFDSGRVLALQWTWDGSRVFFMYVRKGEVTEF